MILSRKDKIFPFITKTAIPVFGSILHLRKFLKSLTCFDTEHVGRRHLGHKCISHTFNEFLKALLKTQLKINRFFSPSFNLKLNPKPLIWTMRKYIKFDI